MSRRQSRALTKPRAILPPALEGVDMPSIVNFMKVHVKQSTGGQVSWSDLYDGMLWYYPAPAAPIIWPQWIILTRDKEPDQPPPPTAAEFGAAVAFICNMAGIRTRIEGVEAYCLGVAYTPPRCSQAPLDLRERPRRWYSWFNMWKHAA